MGDEEVLEDVLDGDKVVAWGGRQRYNPHNCLQLRVSKIIYLFFISVGKSADYSVQRVMDSA